MKILVTGANGQLGRALNRALQDDNVTLINTEAGAVAAANNMRALDITDVDAVLAAVRAEKPDVIMNCAAYTSVDKQEKDVDLSFRINAIGARNLAIAASDADAKLVHISTDYVFDGKGTRPYTEFDTPCPDSVYGKGKLAGEQFVKSFAKRYFILRTAWLYGDGSNFAKTMLRLAADRDEVSVVDDQVGSPTSAKELAQCIRALYATDNYGLFHATCEGSCAWADFAEEIFRLAGAKTRVKRISTQTYQEMNPDSAPRPAYSILDNYMLRLTDAYRFADWRDAYHTYTEENS